MKENPLWKKTAHHKAPLWLLLALLLCSLASCGSVNESLCSLLSFRPDCKEDNCNASYVNASACGVKFDENGNVVFVSASRAASKYKIEYRKEHVDTKHLSSLTTVKTLFLYESGLTTLDESIGSLSSLKHLYTKLKNIYIAATDSQRTPSIHSFIFFNAIGFSTKTH